MDPAPTPGARLRAAAPAMQARDELYQHPGYDAYEQELDQLFARERGE